MVVLTSGFGHHAEFFCLPAHCPFSPVLVTLDVPQTRRLNPAAGGARVGLAGAIRAARGSCLWLTPSVLSSSALALFSCSASLGACQAEHHECHCQPQPVCHPGLRCRWLSRAHRDVDEVRCCVQCPAGLRCFPCTARLEGGESSDWHELVLLTTMVS